MISTGQYKQRLIDSATMFVVSGVSLLLLMYIAFGEAQRTHQQYFVEKLAAQAKVIQISLENYLRPGLPLTQYAGFTTKAEPIVASDDTITSLSVFNSSGDALFSAGDISIPLVFVPLELERDARPDYQVESSETYIQVVLPLRNRFETVGHLAITMERVAVTDRVQEIFSPLLYIALGLSLAFAAFVAIGSPRFAHARFPWLQVGFSVTFITMAVFVVGTLIVLYSEGTQAKARALADSLGQRLSDLVSFGLNLEEIYGLDDIFNNYLRLNPDISAAGIAVDGAVKIIDQDHIEDEWVPGGSTYHYIVDLTPPGGEREISVFVALPEAVVYREIIRSVKNFAALFIASAFLAGVFLQLARSMQRLRVRWEQGSSPDPHGETGEAALSLVKPVFFLAVLVEHLTYSFLPQYINGIVEEAQLSQSIVSAPFMVYYLFFALSLIPAGHFAQRSSPKPLMYMGLLLAAVGLVMLALPGDIALVIVARAVSGIGQGMLFIGVQSYILTMASPERKTQGAAIIVFGFQGGMISGMAVGSLLVTYIGPEAVFVVAGAIASAVALYALMIVPTPKRQEASTQTIGENVMQIMRTMVQVSKDIQFLKTMFLIGIPAKAILTGIIIFALPLLLSQRGYPQEDIGQIIMVYAARRHHR